MTTDLGPRQRRLLIEIAHYGGGRWPSGWKMRGTDKAVMASLAARQLVSSPGLDARLTSAGHLIVASLRGEIQ